MANATAPTTVTCTAPVELIGDRMIVRLSADASAALPSRGQVAANVRIQANTLATVIEPDGRRGHWVAVPDQVRGALGLSAGSDVELHIEPVDQWPEPTVPGDFASALDDADEAHAVWDDITPMARWEWVRWIGATKNPATRQRRVEVGIDKLRSGKRRPCCFDLSSCTDPELAKSGKLIQPS